MHKNIVHLVLILRPKHRAPARGIIYKKKSFLLRNLRWEWRYIRGLPLSSDWVLSIAPSLVSPKKVWFNMVFAQSLNISCEVCVVLCRLYRAVSKVSNWSTRFIFCCKLFFINFVSAVLSYLISVPIYLVKLYSNSMSIILSCI